MQRPFKVGDKVIAFHHLKNFRAEIPNFTYGYVKGIITKELPSTMFVPAAQRFYRVSIGRNKLEYTFGEDEMMLDDDLNELLYL